MSRFNELLHGEPDTVIRQLEDTPATEQELRVALQNAFQRIARLEVAIQRRKEKPE